jgi:hypothetical protein
VVATRGRSSEAEHQLPKLRTRVRFSSPALIPPRRSGSVSTKARTARHASKRSSCNKRATGRRAFSGTIVAKARRDLGPLRTHHCRFPSGSRADAMAEPQTCRCPDTNRYVTSRHSRAWRMKLLSLIRRTIRKHMCDPEGRMVRRRGSTGVWHEPTLAAQVKHLFSLAACSEVSCFRQGGNAYLPHGQSHR